VLGRAERRSDPQVKQLLARHAAMLGSYYAGDRAAAERMLAECAKLAPELAGAYATLGARLASRRA
jgi:hypothetical protein